jgi:hypothetical protein
VVLICKAADEIIFFKSFELKINELVVRTNNFAGLVARDLGPDVACGPLIWPRSLTALDQLTYCF